MFQWRFLQKLDICDQCVKGAEKDGFGRRRRGVRLISDVMKWMELKEAALLPRLEAVKDPMPLFTSTTPQLPPLWRWLPDSRRFRRRRLATGRKHDRYASTTSRSLAPLLAATAPKRQSRLPVCPVTTSLIQKFFSRSSIVSSLPARYFSLCVSISLFFNLSSSFSITAATFPLCFFFSFGVFPGRQKKF